MSELRIGAIVVAGGRGERAGPSAQGPKQYRHIGGRPVIRRTVEGLLALPEIDRIVVVIHRDDSARLADALEECSRCITVAHGGRERQDSVRAGLAALGSTAPDLVLIHDAVRPFASARLIRRVIAATDKATGAIPALPVTDTLKRSSARGEVDATVSRERLYAVQTPQAFPYALLLELHAEAAAAGVTVTDDAGVFEWGQRPVRIVEGEAENVKLTTARDIAMADERLSAGRIDVRTGNGYDVHQLVEGDHVTLCGIHIPHDQRLAGHSDADVGLHALTDALLATCGAGDIGDHFPPSDPRWKGAASHIFVEKAVEIIAAKGGRIMNADISLICEAPKIAPHRMAMREAIAAMTGLDLDRVSVKATTNETIGFVGRREGIAAIATASVIYGDGQ
ncbi:bifunctional 2-C-methyl-D-erythritol 4-phosphate cytidylyltransferase/2-C-methyl-D-erythritol 2,4-cyclodiphosphate synthase [Mangrovicella endophytica]|uniref:bifunctional 2-C-methyl-D-erythritol 4-phosphate cytidylyltransferase/2-C-methyl-D-erythritol 2,4-cyclodiphosphate synthase n=1 Tax=Mangrovicella endophytica TaxID=2066697 RepID=UPI000C9E24F6|nr:bifunctional 2-C-methyl-D-erythritol 4-phosphate cytidylyltransferase/2-C-methyl-D-erythritol 2,4-cyclodiphosphate synthase [Mangrovicella endophytica]